jgi:hypothetical protein
MQERRTSEFYRQLSPQDRIQFDRWLKANAVVASIFSAALVAMAFLGAPFSGPVNTSAAHIRTASISPFPADGGTLWEKVPRKVHEARQHRSQGSQ